MPSLIRWLTPAVFVLLGLIWGSSFLWIKIALTDLGPATLVAERMTLGAAGMLLYLVAIRQPFPRRWRELAPLGVLGLINAGLPIFLISWGEVHVDSGTAAVLNSLVPLFSLLIAGVWLRTEAVTALRVTGLILGFGGAVILASRELSLTADPLAVVGAGAVVLAAASYAFGASYAKHRITRTHRYVVAAGTLVFAALWLWILAIASEWPIRVPVHADTIVALLWLGILGSFVAYLCYFFLIEHLDATISTMVTYLFPVVGVALGTIFLDEVLDERMILGTILVLAGIVVVGLRYDARLSREPRGVPE